MDFHNIIVLIKSNFLTHILLAYIFLSSGLIINVLQLLTLPLWFLGFRETYRYVIGKINYMTWSSKYCNIYS